jgi:S1-C subfamily serine protease
MRLLTVALLCIAMSSIARAGVGPEATQKLYERVTPSLVAAKFTWESEMGRREFAGTGVVVREDGLVMCQIGLLDPRIFPDEQLKDFKIVVPDPTGGDPDELDARLLGRDERYNVAFLQPKDPDKADAKDSKDAKDAKDSDKSTPAHKWVPIKFEDVAVKVGEPILSVGMLPEMAAYKSYVMETAVSVTLRGEQPQVLVQGGGLTSIGAPVFNAEGKAIGVVVSQAGQTPLLNDKDPRLALNAINNPPRFFLPARDFLPALSDLPTEGKPVAMPWLGLPQLTGLNKDVSEVFGLKNQPAIQIGEVIPDAPAQKAGLKRGDIIVKIDGQPLERGDEPDELPQIFRRQMTRMKVGQTIKFGVLRAKGEPLQEISVTMGESPKRANTAKRWYAEDLGFSAREVVFTDTYVRRLKADARGVIVSFVRPQSAAQSAGLQMEDLITELNRTPVDNLEAFQKSYEEFRKNKPKEAVVMVVLREGNTQTIRIEPPQ